MNVVWWNELQFMTLFYVFDKGSSFLLVCCLLIWNMDCLLSKDPVLPILHAWVNSIFFFIFYVVLSGDICRLSVSIEGSSVTYSACVGVFHVFDRVFASCCVVFENVAW